MGNHPPVMEHRGTPYVGFMRTDKELVKLAQAQDAGAFEELVRRYARLVWATVSGMIRDRSWTEDIVQETFLQAWKSLTQLEKPAAFRPWTLSIARRLVFRHTQMQGRSFDLPKPTPEELSNLDQETTRDHVQAAIQRLPERYRLPVTLRFLNEMDYAGISQELELSNGALRGLLNRGVKMLKLELEPFWKKNR